MKTKGSRFRLPGLTSKHVGRVLLSRPAALFAPAAAATVLAGHVLFLGPAVEAQAPPPSFAATVYPVFEKANCRACHTDEGVASGTRLHFPPETGTTARAFLVFRRRS